MKKILALVLALAMMATVVSAFAVDFSGAAVQSTEPTGTITITNLDPGDTVTFYQVIGWFTEKKTVGEATNTLAGWKVMEGYPAQDIKDYYATEMTQAKVAEISGNVHGTPDDTKTVAQGATSITSDPLPVGMYLALVKTATSNIYNPMLLSVNFNQNDPTNAISPTMATSSEYINGGAAKKQPTTLDKNFDDASTDFALTPSAAPDNNGTTGGPEDGVYLGSHVPFKVTVTVPNYSTDYTNPEFKVTDVMSTGLTLDKDSVKVYWGDDNSTSELVASNQYDLTKSDHGYVLSFLPDYLYKVKSEQKVTIKYTGTITTDIQYNVERENNTVTLVYSNNPSDEGSHGTTSDETNHYTFSLDADIFGEDSGKSSTSELIKTGLDGDGQPIYTWNNKTSDTWTKVAPLAGAKFVLTGTGANAGFTSEYTTKSDGKIKFFGLDEGTYTLTEESAPQGWMKDPNSHTVEISAVYTTEKNGSSKDIKKLQSYTVTIDGANTTTYTLKNEGQDVVKTSEVTVDNTTNIVNTKGLELPSTGGVGTTLFYLIGGLMALAAGIVLISRRKAEEE